MVSTVGRGWLIASLFGLLLVQPSVAQYEVYVHSGDTAMGSITNPASFPATVSQVSTISAAANPGYRFVEWTVDAGDISIIHLNAPDSTMILVGNTNDIYIVTAHFEPITYRLRVFNNGSGSVTVDGVPAATGGTFPASAAVGLEAAPDVHNVFVQWNSTPVSAVVGTNAATTVIMDEDTDVYATFASAGKLHLVVDSRDGSGRIAGNPVVNGNYGAGTTLFDYNDSVDIIVDDAGMASAGERVMQNGWVRDYGSGSIHSGIGVVPRFQITEDTKYTFSWRTEFLLDVSVITGTHSSGSVILAPRGVPNGSGGYWYSSGSVVQLQARAAMGSRFVQWSGDIEDHDDVSPNPIIMNGPKTVEASFESVPVSDGLNVLSLTSQGQLVWSSQVVDGYATVEWASSLQGPWSRSWEALTHMPVTTSVSQVSVPLFYRLIWDDAELTSVQSATVTIDFGNGQQTAFSANLATRPIVPGSVRVTAGDAVLYDTSTGALRASDGTGTVNYASGALAVQFAVAPAVETPVEVNCAYSTPGALAFAESLGTADGQDANFEGTLRERPIVKGSVVVVAGTEVLRDNGDGILQGAGFGTVDYDSGAIWVGLFHAPDAGVNIIAQYHYVSGL